MIKNTNQEYEMTNNSTVNENEEKNKQIDTIHCTHCHDDVEQCPHDHEHCGCHHEHSHIDEALPHVHQGVTIQFTGEFETSIENLWAILTGTNYVKQWFPELEFTKLHPGGELVYHYKEGGQEEMTVLDVETPKLLSFSWDINIVTFELTAVSDNITNLTFNEWIPEVHDYTANDLTAWMIALQSMSEIVEGREISNREAKFDEILPKMQELLEQQIEIEFE